ncbi:MAG: GNAT family N-acetyltransferase [Gammaproteobacteria bacterium]|nr:GNAT family N-acetyltransferase [Gammaproteobacteria bacterium]
MTEERWWVRPATMEDLDDLVAWNQAMAVETEERRLDPAILRRGIEPLIHDRSLGHYFVVENGDRRTFGCLAVTTEWSDWRAGLFWWIQSVYIHPDARRSGAFAALYRHVERLARAEPEVIGLRLYVERDNERAMATYRRLGMNETDYRLYEVEFD